MMPLLVAAAVAFSGGGGDGTSDDGIPFLQSCDAINVCAAPCYFPSGMPCAWDATGALVLARWPNQVCHPTAARCLALPAQELVCPKGMTAVAPPERSPVYRLTASATHYVPGELLHLELRVTQRLIVAKKSAGRLHAGNESAKYIGILLYAVRSDDVSETKVGQWEIPLQTPPRFHTPDDPGCGSKALMHANAERKSFIERFRFRAPEAGTGALTFRCLIKQGETNRGAFYWAGEGGVPPAPGLANGDLVLPERSAPPPPRPWALRGALGESCTNVCGNAGLLCDEAALESVGASSPSLQAAVAPHFLCAPPLIVTCDEASPRMSGLGDGLCFYYDGESCPAPAADRTPRCDAVTASASTSFEDGLRLCPCVDETTTSGRRLATADAEGLHAPEARDPMHFQEGAIAEEPCKDGRETDGSGGGGGGGGSGSADEEGRTPRQPHGDGGDPSRCPSMRAASRALATATPGSATTDAVTATRVPVALEDSAGQRARSLLGAAFLLVLLGGSFVLSAQWRRGGGAARWRQGGTAALGVTMLAAPSSAHNWMHGLRSRANYDAGKASTTQPCRARTQFSHPHVNVNAGQAFMAEWMTGHGGDVIFLLLKAEDEPSLTQFHPNVFNAYLRDAPPEAYARYNNS